METVKFCFVAGIIAGSTFSANAAIFEVDIMDSAFQPQAIVINLSDSVKWTNRDFMAHTVTSTSGPASFNSGTLNFGNTYLRQFTIEGIYRYRCNFHTFMTGQVTVVPEPVTLIGLGLSTLLFARRRRT